MMIEGYECYLVDDGTLDTVISIDGTEHRFDTEYASHYRDADGGISDENFRELCLVAIRDIEMEA